MGIRGLLKHIRNTDIRPPTLILSSETRRQYGTKTAVLACDFIAIFFWILDVIGKSRSRYVELYGMDFNECREKLIGLIEALRHINIEPVFFWDGARGADSHYEMKLSTWEKRTLSLLETIDSHARISKYDPKTEVKSQKRIKRPLLMDELAMSLKACGVTLRICNGEADSVMADYMRAERNVCGILTNDTDMMLMTGCIAIHYKFFDFNNDLKLSEPKMNKQPSEIHCHAIGPEYLAKHLKIDKECLPALSILCGNDYTSGFNEEPDVKKMLPFDRRGYVGSVISWIKCYTDSCKDSGSFLKITLIKTISEVYPKYEAAVKYSYNFYDPSCRSDSADYLSCPSPLCAYIASKVEANKINRKCLPIVKNGILYRDSISQLDDKLPCIHETLLPIRKIIYQLLCCPRVDEYGQEKTNCFRNIPIDVTMLVNPRTLVTLREETSPPQKLSILHFVLNNHTLPDDVDTLVCIPPMACDELTEDISPYITCISFMYFHRKGLVPLPEYITPLLLACFHCSLGLSPPGLSSRPGPTGITISSQFMMVLQHVQWFLSLLGIHDELPLPSTVFQPYIYIPLHGTAFKLTKKEKFYGGDVAAKDHFNYLSTNKRFEDFKKCICDRKAIDHVQFVVSKFKETRDELMRALEKKKTTKKVTKN